MVKLAFIGVGYMGQNAHLVNFARNPECEVVAIVDAKTQQARLVAEAYGVKKVFSSIKELMDTTEVDGFVASQPYRSHRSLLPELFAYKKPVFTEKPIALSAEAGQELVDLAEKNGVVHMVGYHKRSDPAMEFAIEKINEFKESGKLGAMTYIRSTMPAGDWVSGAPTIIRTDEPFPEVVKEGDVGYYADDSYNKFYDKFVNYYIHQVNAIRYLLSENYSVTYAEKSNTLLVCTSESGITCTLEMSPYTTSIDWFESYLVCFEHGYVLIELPAPLASQRCGKVTVFEDVDNKPITWSPTLPNLHAMKNQANNFIEVVKGTRKPPADGRTAVLDLLSAKEYVSLVSKL